MLKGKNQFLKKKNQIFEVFLGPVSILAMATL
jgi:hypothetical protein